ncbi:MAG: FAA hydrolase family protein [Planctomycetota bacterium]|mgnify:CR=1 FL=1|nr:MAG: FAA hydrolase family protein [Planctomycetota bacterium]REJ96133.1 MAG: FAA hydrolase family protein [Planctomycetota bacterium]REK22742.1 MAG: FAA hydrolase family protein [Planctomycetota bacterium]REK33838.1 MAG: FAA hydrolase family protein [Planctomycetota bacterium]
MRLCRFQTDERIRIGFYDEHRVLPLEAVAALVQKSTRFPVSESIVDYLPGGAFHREVRKLERQLDEADPAAVEVVTVPVDAARLLVPVAHPSKLLLLAGNYSKHIEEGGGKAEERSKTFPYVFMKPPLTTLTHPGDPVKIPAVSPDEIDWELELGVIIGRECRNVSEADALSYVAGYTVVNDISDRAFKPNPGRAERPKDGFFDWLHGKWHDTFCPIGPCVLPADRCDDPQQLALTLKLNGEIEQNASTADMVFPVAAVVEFVSSFVTLQPGDVISTGTPDGVGKAKGKFLKPGDVLEAEIEGIGLLRNPVE